MKNEKDVVGEDDAIRTRTVRILSSLPPAYWATSSYRWRIPNLTSNSVIDRSPFPINPTIFNVDALIGSLFTTH